MIEPTASPIAPPHPDDDRVLAYSRLYDAPRERVFEAWTDPAQIVRWWGPNGFTTTTERMEVRPGGQWIYVMHGPDGKDWDNRIIYSEVVRPERLVYTHDAGEKGTDPPFHVTVTFTPEGAGTRLGMRMLLVSAAERERVQKFGAVEGAHQTLQRLAEHLAAQ